jgi:hypothetical protein
VECDFCILSGCERPDPTTGAAALFEVLGIYLAGACLSDQIAKLALHWRLISDANPFDLLTVHAINAKLLVASRQLFVVLMVLCASYFELIILSSSSFRSTAGIGDGDARRMA